MIYFTWIDTIIIVIQPVCTFYSHCSAEGQFESFQEKIDTLEKENTSQREQIQSLENANKLHKNTIQFLNLQNAR